MICPPFMPLNILFDLSKLYKNKDLAQKNFMKFRNLFFNSTEPARLLRSNSTTRSKENLDSDLLFHFSDSSIGIYDCISSKQNY